MYENAYKDAVDFILEKTDQNLATFKTSFPAPSSSNLNYAEWENVEWTPGFWTGILWMAFQKTHEEKYLKQIKGLLPSFEQRLKEDTTLDTHDIGFIYTLSLSPAVRLFNNSKQKELLIKAAQRLMQRFDQTAGIVQAWGNPDEPAQQGRMIIDSLLNLPLLYEATKLTGDPVYYQAAYRHAKQAQKYLVREDHSTFHTFFMDILTGNPDHGETAQGVSNHSTWARGQAWAVYGFALNYYHTGDCSMLQTAIQTADYYLKYLPEDDVPYWDLTVAGDEPRDSSAAAILACGLLEIAKNLPITSQKRSQYEAKAQEIVLSLAQNYTTKNVASNGILKEGVYSIPHQVGVRECCIWGDYFYFEALMRLTQMWQPYWF